jgi:hypothetical protein
MMGDAVIVSVTPPADAVVVFGFQDALGVQAHSGTPTYCVASSAGAIMIGGAGIFSVPYA